MTLVSKLFSLLLLLTVSACASNPRLSYVSPTAINLSGDWVLNEPLSQTVVMFPAKRKPTSNGAQPAGRADNGRSSNPVVRPERRAPGLENEASPVVRKPAAMVASAMKIEQGADGMGIAYPKHTYRDVDWGSKETRDETIWSGWAADNALVIQTNSDQQKFREAYRLDASGKTLTITFTVNSFKGEQDFVRVFQKKGSE